MSKESVAGSGITLPWVLTIVLMVLKLCKVINWKWIWVFAPVWITIALALIMMVVYIIMYYWRSDDEKRV